MASCVTSFLSALNSFLLRGSCCCFERDKHKTSQPWQAVSQGSYLLLIAFCLGLIKVVVCFEKGETYFLSFLLCGLRCGLRVWMLFWALCSHYCGYLSVVCSFYLPRVYCVQNCHAQIAIG